jgi:hypothetical protein
MIHYMAVGNDKEKDQQVCLYHLHKTKESKHG